MSCTLVGVKIAWFPGAFKYMQKRVRKGRVPALRVAYLTKPMGDQATFFVDMSTRRDSKPLPAFLVADRGDVVLDAADVSFGPALSANIYGFVVYADKSLRPVAHVGHTRLPVLCSSYTVTWDSKGLFRFPNKNKKS